MGVRVLGSWVGVVCLAVLGASGAGAAERPNVVWILLDACRADHLSCYGYERETTPQLDALARRGVLFERNFSQAPCTVESMPSYLTGKYFPQSSMAGLEKALRDDEKIVPAVLGAHGYATVLLTVHPWWTPRSRLWQAFDEAVFVPPPYMRAYAELGEIKARLFAIVDRHKDGPFFVYVHTLDTHRPHRHHADYAHWFPGGTVGMRPVPPFSEKEQAWLRAEYDASLAYADSQVGEIVAGFESAGLAGNTIFVVSSDHGELLGEDGRTLSHPSTGRADELYHTPLIMAGPGLPAGKRVGALTEYVDIAPTLYELLGVRTTARLDGRSLAPLMRGVKPGDWRRYTFAKLGRANRCYMLRTTAFKYVWDLDSGEEALYRVPDRFGYSEAVRNPAAMKALKQAVTRHIVPLYRDYAALRGLRFRAVGGKNAVMSDAEFARRAEQLRALGYLE